MKRIKDKRWLAVILGIAVVLLAGGCTKPAPKLYKYESQYFESDYFDTVTIITYYLENEDQFNGNAEWVENELARYHKLFDIYNNYPGINNLKTINDNAGIAPVTVDAEIIRLLKFSMEQYELTGGKVNIAMGSVLSIWHEYREAGMKNKQGPQIPDMEQLNRANAYTDIHEIQIDEAKSTVYLPNENMRLDVGAVGKGYAVQKISEGLRKNGVTSALISAGGNIQTIGLKEGKTPWRVGIQNPDVDDSRGYLHAMSLQDMALVTSGSYLRYYEVDGVRYHHIIDSATLMPKNEYVAVTILYPDSSVADVLSTALFSMSLEEGMTLINAIDGAEALWVYPDGKEVLSPGFNKYIDD